MSDDRLRIPSLDDLNGRGDLRIESRAGDVLRLHVGDCCLWCASAAVVTFRGTTAVDGWDDDEDRDRPRFRLAAQAEIDDRGLHVPAGSTAFCVVTSYGYGPSGPRIYIVARDFEIELIDRVPG